MGSPLNVSYAELFRFMLQFLCLQMCVHGGSAVPEGGVGDRHLVTVPTGWWGTVFPGVGNDKGRGGYQEWLHEVDLSFCILGLRHALIQKGLPRREEAPHNTACSPPQTKPTCTTRRIMGRTRATPNSPMHIPGAKKTAVWHWGGGGVPDCVCVSEPCPMLVSYPA